MPQYVVLRGSINRLGHMIIAQSIKMCLHSGRAPKTIPQQLQGIWYAAHLQASKNSMVHVRVPVVGTVPAAASTSPGNATYPSSRAALPCACSTQLPNLSVRCCNFSHCWDSNTVKPQRLLTRCCSGRGDSCCLPNNVAATAQLAATLLRRAQTGQGSASMIRMTPRY